MGYGNGMSGSKRMIRKPAIRKKMYSKEFSSVYSNADAKSGDCKITSSSRRLTSFDGTLTYRKGYPKVTFTSDDRRTSFSFSLREVISERIVRGAHIITIP